MHFGNNEDPAITCIRKQLSVIYREPITSVGNCVAQLIRDYWAIYDTNKQCHEACTQLRKQLQEKEQQLQQITVARNNFVNCTKAEATTTDKPQTIQEVWEYRCKLRAEGSKLYAEGHKLHAEGNKLRAEGSKLRAEGDKLRAEGSKLYAEADKLWAEGGKLRAEGDIVWLTAVIKEFGNVEVKYDNDGNCTVKEQVFKNTK